MSHNRDVYELIRTVAWNATLNVSGGIGEGERTAGYVRRTLEPYVERAEAERDAALADLAAARATIAALREAMRPALEAEARATPGEWKIGPSLCGCECVWHEETGRWVAQVFNRRDEPFDNSTANALFIVAARNALSAVRALLSEEAPDAA